MYLVRDQSMSGLILSTSKPENDGTELKITLVTPAPFLRHANSMIQLENQREHRHWNIRPAFNLIPLLSFIMLIDLIIFKSLEMCWKCIYNVKRTITDWLGENDDWFIAFDLDFGSVLASKFDKLSAVLQLPAIWIHSKSIKLTIN